MVWLFAAFECFARYIFIYIRFFLAYNESSQIVRFDRSIKAMPRAATQHRKPVNTLSRSVPSMERWKLEDAKARLSEVVRLAETAGPQLVTIRGKEAAVILAPEQYKRLLPRPKGQQSLVRFLQGLGLSQLDVKRESDTGREIAL
jgi:prevent-host-death family protein